MNDRRPKIFISHAAVDVGIAEYLETSLRQASPQIEVFRTTRVGQIPSGTEWFSRITSELRAADKYLVLLTPWGMARPWVCFETGAAWISNKTLVTVVAGGMSKSEAVEPLKFLQLLSIEHMDEAEMAFTELGCVLPDPEGFVQTVLSLSVLARNRSLEEDGWDKVEVDGKVYAWDGPLEKLSDGIYKPIPVDKYAAFQATGIELVSGDPNRLDGLFAKGYSPLHLIDFDRGRKHRLLTRDSQVLMVKRVDV